MGGVVGFVSEQDCVMDLFFGQITIHTWERKTEECVCSRRTDSTDPYII